MMKKVICILLAMVMTITVVAGCSKDEQEEEKKIMELEGMNITAENVSPYEGRFYEDPVGETVSGIYAMKFTNTGDETIRTAQLIFSNGTDEMVFWLEMLPAGASVTVAELNMLPAAEGEINYVDGTVSYLETGLENANCVKVSSGDNGMIHVENTTDEMLPLVRVFYRHTDGEGNLLGGPCYSAMIDGIEAGGTAEAEAEYWTGDCQVVTVLVVNE